MPASCEAQVALDGAHDVMRRRALPLEPESVGIADAPLRVLAQPLRARIASPRRDIAAMDGFALHDAALRAGRREFDVAGASYAGDPACGRLALGSAMRITTGAALPLEADRVVPFELVDEQGGTIHLREEITDARHVRVRATDFEAGEILLEPGALLDPPRLLVAAASDQPTMTVYRQPRISLIASGDELTPPGKTSGLAAGVPDSLSGPLILLAQQWGGVPIGRELLRDDIRAITEAARRATARSDVLLLVGGAASGGRDFARSALTPLGLDLLFAGVAIKPGKPVWYGRLGSTHVLGLPGNPVAAMLVARLFLAPLLCALGGRGFDTALEWRDAVLGGSLPPGGGRETFLFARRDGNRVVSIERQSASNQRSLAWAEQIIRRPAGAAALVPGTTVPVLDL